MAAYSTSFRMMWPEIELKESEVTKSTLVLKIDSRNSANPTRFLSFLALLLKWTRISISDDSCWAFLTNDPNNPIRSTPNARISSWCWCRISRIEFLLIVTVCTIEITQNWRDFTARAQGKYKDLRGFVSSRWRLYRKGGKERQKELHAHQVQ